MLQFFARAFNLHLQIGRSKSSKTRIESLSLIELLQIVRRLEMFYCLNELLRTLARMYDIELKHINPKKSLETGMSQHENPEKTVDASNSLTNILFLGFDSGSISH